VCRVYYGKPTAACVFKKPTSILRTHIKHTRMRSIITGVCVKGRRLELLRRGKSPHPRVRWRDLLHAFTTTPAAGVKNPCWSLAPRTSRWQTPNKQVSRCLPMSTQVQSRTVPREWFSAGATANHRAGTWLFPAAVAEPYSGTQIAVLVPLPLCQRVRSVALSPSVFSQQRQLNGNQTRSAVVQMCIKERVWRAVIKSASRAVSSVVKPSTPRSVLACESRDATTVLLLKSILARFYNDENKRPRCVCDNSCFDRA